jgi:hypothetical protein
VLQAFDLIGGFTDLARPEPAVLRVQWIPASAGMTTKPVRARNLITASKAGIHASAAPRFFKQLQCLAQSTIGSVRFGPWAPACAGVTSE